MISGLTFYFSSNFSVFPSPSPFALCPPPKAMKPAAIRPGGPGAVRVNHIHPDRISVHKIIDLTHLVRVVRVKSNILHMRAHTRARAVSFFSVNFIPLFKKNPDHPDQSSQLPTSTDQNPVRVDHFHPDRTRTTRTDRIDRGGRDVGLEKIKDVYNPLVAKDLEVEKETAPSDPENRPLINWPDSAAVVALSDYLKVHSNQGIKLYCYENGMPCLMFLPGLKRGDGDERWNIAIEASHLLLSATKDLGYLIENGVECHIL